MKVDVILPAAGTSERMNLPVAKQFLKVLGKHVLAYTVDGFHRLPWVRHIIIVVSPDQTEFTQELMRSYGFSKVKVCAGSHTRHRSISCGLQELKAECSGCDVVIIHDAARPFVSEQVARQVAEAAMTHGAAGVTRPLVSTVIRGDGEDRLVESLDRRVYRNSEMPQAFHYEVITSAYEQCSEDDLDHGTECLLLALKYCQCRAALVEGTDDLWKVTYQKDVYSMESVVKEKLMIVSVINEYSQEFLALEELDSRLSQQQIKLAAQVDYPANTFVVVWQRGQSLEDASNKICRLYLQNMPSSAVKLDLMVVIVFLQSSHSVHSGTDKSSIVPGSTSHLSNKSSIIPGSTSHLSNKSSIIPGSTSHLSNKSSIVPGSTSHLSNKSSIVPGSISHLSNKSSIIPGSTSHLSNKSSIVPGSTSHLSNKSSIVPGSTSHLSNKSSIVPGSTSHLSNQLHDQHVAKVQVVYSHADLHASSDLPGVSPCSSVDNTHFPAPEPHGCSSSVYLTSPAGDLGSNCVKTLGLPTDTCNSYGQQGEGHLTSCRDVVKEMKGELERNIGGRFVLAVGVSCGRRSPVGERLVELIWQRSLCVDGQVLVFDDWPV